METIMDLPKNTPKVAIRWIGRLQKENDELRKENFCDCARFGRIVKLRDEEIAELKLVKTQKEEVIDFIKGALSPMSAKIDDLKKEIARLQEENWDEFYYNGGFDDAIKQYQEK